MKRSTWFISLMILMFQSLLAQEKSLKINSSELIFSAIKGTAGKPDTLLLTSSAPVKIKDFRITGEAASYFKFTSAKPKQVTPQKKEIAVLVFEPPVDFIGIARATLQIQGPNINIPLTGLSTKGLEGENEAPLSMIFEALGYTTNAGWKTLANHWRPELQGDELAPALFQKAMDGPVNILPVARYSPDFPLNYGFYVNTLQGPKQNQVGVLAKMRKFPEHQTLFPAIDSRQTPQGTTFDPGNNLFGFYATSPDHTLYSEDQWNILFNPTRATHAVRIYPAKDKKGAAIENTYLVCMEEATNGDFNDYVFLVSNLKPVFKEFTPLMNGKNFEGWYTWLQGKGKNKDEENNFTMEDGGVLHDTGKTLGYIMCEERFSNFHLKLEFKWGEKKWPPRENAKRDSGICYNVPDGEDDFIWPASIECQIQEGDVGDFWLIEYSTIQVDGKQNAPSHHTQIVKKKDGERPTGEWNTVEVISFNGKCAHIVNGVLVNFGDNASLIGGRLLLQSEYAEIFYRNIKIRKL